MLAGVSDNQNTARPITEDHLLYDSIYTKLSRVGKFINSESRLVVARVWEKENEGWGKGVEVGLG